MSPIAAGQDESKAVAPACWSDGPWERAFMLADDFIDTRATYSSTPAVAFNAILQSGHRLILVAAPANRAIHLITSLGTFDSDALSSFQRYAETKPRKHLSDFALIFLTCLEQLYAAAQKNLPEQTLITQLRLWHPNVGDTYVRWRSQQRQQRRRDRVNLKQMPQHLRVGLFGVLDALLHWQHAQDKSMPLPTFREELNRLAAPHGIVPAHYNQIGYTDAVDTNDLGTDL
jgi:hypothetical protein